MRLIDADALLKKKDEIYIPPEDPEETWCFGANIEVIHIDDVKDATTIDPEELRPKGRWKYKWDAEKDPKRLFVRIVCSECNLHTGQRSNYCPNCGARMEVT